MPMPRLTLLHDDARAPMVIDATGATTVDVLVAVADANAVATLLLLPPVAAAAAAVAAEGAPVEA